MIYYEQNGLRIRDMDPADVAAFVAGELAQGWQHASPDKLNARVGHRENGECVLLTAEQDGDPAGYVSVYWKSPGGPFVDTGIPEIVDFNVLVKFRRRGIGNAMMDVCEGIAASRCDRVCIGVGLHSGYGAAQRIYVKRGYIPDGTGVWYRDGNLDPYADCCNDDDLVLYLSKPLK